MSLDFKDAAQRHWSDAELLYAEQRWPNADQLYGVAAECSLKAIMKSLGMPIDSHDKPKDRRHRVHINRLWSEFQTFAQGKGASTYAAMLPSTNPFLDWGVDQRYWHSNQIAQTTVQPHRQGSGQARMLLNRARQDGMVE